jgi:hypothetical protein
MQSFEILSGLPGTGPPARYFYHESNAPWREGAVIRFRPASSAPWVGNFEPGHFGPRISVTSWPAAASTIVLAAGACYLFADSKPENYVVAPTAWVGSVLVVSDPCLALVADLSCIHAYAKDRRLVWSRGVAVDGIELVRVEGSTLVGQACLDPCPARWEPFRIDLRTGKDA